MAGAGKQELFQRLAGRARADDTQQTIRNRLRIFAASNGPLLHYYQQLGLLTRVDGVGDPDELTELVVARLEAMVTPNARPRALAATTASGRTRA